MEYWTRLLSLRVRWRCLHVAPSPCVSWPLAPMCDQESATKQKNSSNAATLAAKQGTSSSLDFLLGCLLEESLGSSTLACSCGLHSFCSCSLDSSSTCSFGSSCSFLACFSFCNTH